MVSPGRGDGGGAANKKDVSASVPGKVNINARPWAEVTVDGKGRGFTPVLGLALPPGTHTVVLLNPKLGAERKLKIRVEQETSQDVFVDFEKEQQ